MFGNLADHHGKYPAWAMQALLTLACLSTMTAGVANGQAVDRPNIVLIMADDLGFADVGCFGSEIETPRLDELAAGGLRMTQFYNTAKCHSSRVSLLTGLYCDQAGAESLARGTTIARQLRQAGYFTAMAGKWHLHDEPTDHGFDRYFGHLSGATNFFTGDNTFRLNGQPWKDFDDDFYTTIANTDYGIRFIDESLEQQAEGKQAPFFLYMAYNAPHYPLHVIKEDFEKYRGKYQAGWDRIRQQRMEKQRQLELFDPDTITDLGRPHYIPAWDELSEADRKWEADRMAAYAGMVDRLDHEIGRLVDHLKSKGVYENTLILFVSDNGACPFDRTRGKELQPYDSKSYWTYDTGWAHVGNTPFRYYKQNNHEGGITSPAIIHWPRVIGPGSELAGTISNTPSHLIDVMPTCLDVGKGEYPQEAEQREIEPLMGRSLRPILEGKPVEPHDFLYFHFGPNRGLRIGDWKVASLRSGPWELYDLSRDRNEAHDLAADYPKRVAELSEKWHHVAEHIDRIPAKQSKPVSNKPQDANFKKNGK